MEQSEKAAIAAKIKALLSKTIASGATEAEALSAMNKAHELLEKYQLSMSDLEMKEEGAGTSFYWMDKTSKELAVRVAQFCDCYVYIEFEKKEFVKGKGKKATVEQEKREVIRFVGTKSDVMFAEWLVTALTSFVNGEVLSKELFEDFDDFQSESYRYGMISRLNQRLEEEINRRNAAKAANARSLIVVKNAIVDEYLAKTFRKKPRYVCIERDYRMDRIAFEMGKEKGNTPSLRRPIGREMEAEVKRVR